MSLPRLETDDGAGVGLHEDLPSPGADLMDQVHMRCQIKNFPLAKLYLAIL